MPKHKALCQSCSYHVKPPPNIPSRPSKPEQPNRCGNVASIHVAMRSLLFVFRVSCPKSKSHHFATSGRDRIVAHRPPRVAQRLHFRFGLAKSSVAWCSHRVFPNHNWVGLASRQQIRKTLPEIDTLLFAAPNVVEPDGYWNTVGVPAGILWFSPNAGAFCKSFFDPMVCFRCEQSMWDTCDMCAC